MLPPDNKTLNTFKWEAPEKEKKSQIYILRQHITGFWNSLKKIKSGCLFFPYDFFHLFPVGEGWRYPGYYLTKQTLNVKFNISVFMTFPPHGTVFNQLRAERADCWAHRKTRWDAEVSESDSLPQLRLSCPTPVHKSGPCADLTDGMIDSRSEEFSPINKARSDESVQIVAWRTPPQSPAPLDQRVCLGLIVSVSSSRQAMTKISFKTPFNGCSERQPVKFHPHHSGCRASKTLGLLLDRI